jgi:hypothetical protein
MYPYPFPTQTHKGFTMNITKERLAFVSQFFSYMRPEGGAGQQWFEDRYIDTIPYTWKDAAGNTHLDLRESKTNRTLFVAHTDTVHKVDGRQQPMINAHMMTCDLTDTVATCLGADDGAGVLILLHLIHNRVPAYYIFTRGEERGGIGANHLATVYPHLLAEFDRAIAFDRKGTSSVISHQGWGRCCSDTFADALSDKLSNDWLMYAPDDGGVYTDTAEFVDIIPECTNISAGYMHEHTTKESLNIQHLFDLMEQVVILDWDALPTERDPSIKETLPMPDYYGLHAAYDVGTWYRPQPKTGKAKSKDSPSYDWWDDIQDYLAFAYDAVCSAEDGYPDELLWMTAEVVMPDDADIIYKRIWNAKPSRDLLKATRKAIDNAWDVTSVDDALNKFYVDLLDEQLINPTCDEYAH